MLESDGGVFRPLGFGFTGNDSRARDRAERGHAARRDPGGCSRAVGRRRRHRPERRRRRRCPRCRSTWMGRSTSSYHHTAADTVDKLDPLDVARCVAAVAVMSYVSRTAANGWAKRVERGTTNGRTRGRARARQRPRLSHGRTQACTLQLEATARAGVTIVPRHSPRPIRAQPSRSHHPRKTTSSPSSRKRRVSPLGSVIGSRPAPGQLQQAPARLARRARHRAGAEQIAGRRLQPLLAWWVSSCADRPVEMPQARSADDVRRDLALRACARSTSATSSRRSMPAALALLRAVEIRQRRGIAVGPQERRRAKRLERVERHDPRRDRRREALGEKRTERLVFPRLDVARGPVVQQAHAEEVLLGLVDRDRRRRARCPGPMKTPTSSS